MRLGVRLHRRQLLSALLRRSAVSDCAYAGGIRLQLRLGVRSHRRQLPICEYEGCSRLDVAVKDWRQGKLG